MALEQLANKGVSLYAISPDLNNLYNITKVVITSYTITDSVKYPNLKDFKIYMTSDNSDQIFEDIKKKNNKKE